MLDQLLSEARAHEEAGRLMRAIAGFKQALALQPDDPSVHHRLGMLYSMCGQTDSAIEHLQAAIAIHPDNPDVLNDLGSLLTALDRSDEAIPCFTRALLVRPDFPEAIENYTDCVLASGRAGEAIPFIDSLIRATYCSLEMRFAMGRLFLQQGKFDVAQLHLLRSSQLQPDNPDILFQLALLYKQLGCLSDTQNYLEQVLQLQPKNILALQMLASIQPLIALERNVDPTSQVRIDADAIDRQVVSYVGDGRIQNYTLERRREYGQNLSKLIAGHIPFRDPVATIRETGFARLSPVLTPRQVQEIVAYFQEQPVYNGHVLEFSDQIPRPLTDDYLYPFGSYDLEHTLKAPHLLEAALNPAVLHFISDYLGCIPTLYSFQAWWSLPAGFQAETQQYHRDYDDFRFLVLFIYLTDVTEENGPHCYLRGSHDGPGTTEEIITGPAGTTILADTYGLHKGISPRSARRLVGWVRYGLHRNQHSGVAQTQAISRTLVADRIPAGPEMRYITRLLFRD